jgi:DNA segregation ATPase FtsK/SpoIIIE-like protein
MIKDLAKEYHDELDLKAREEFLIHFKKGDNISTSLIQRKCKVGYNTAVRLINYLNQNAKIDFRSDNAVHVVL